MFSNERYCHKESICKIRELYHARIPVTYIVKISIFSSIIPNDMKVAGVKLLNTLNEKNNIESDMKVLIIVTFSSFL